MPDEPIVSVTFPPKYRDYLAAAILLHPKPVQYAFVALVVSMIYSLRLLLEPPSYKWLVLLCAWLLVGGIARSVAKRFKTLGRTISVALTDRMIIHRATQTDVEGRRNWNMISRVSREYGLILLHVAAQKSVAIIVPERAFGSREEANRFYETALSLWKKGQSERHDLSMCAPPPPKNAFTNASFWSYMGMFLLLLSADLNSQPLGWLGIAACVAAVKFGASERMVVQAQKLFRQGKFEAAIRELQGLVDKGTEDVNPYILCAAAHLQLHQPEPAVKVCTAGIKVAPYTSELYNNRASALLQMMSPEEALADADKAISLNPGLANAHTLRAGAQLQMFYYDAAIASATQAINLNKAGAHLAYVIRGLAHLALNNPQQAFSDCDTAVTLARHPNPANVRSDAVAARALVHIDERRIDEALKDCDEAIAGYAKCYRGWYAKGYALCVAQRPQDALKTIEQVRAIMVSPGDRYAMLSIEALAKYILDKPDEAITAAEAALKIKEHPVVRTYLALALARKGKTAEALEEVNKAIALNSFCTEAYWVRSQLFELLGDKEKRAADAEVAAKGGYKPFLQPLSGGTPAGAAV